MSAPGRPARGRGRLLLPLALCAPLALCVVLALATGAFGIPHNDDWSFDRSALTLHATGHLHLVGWAQMSLVGQLALAQPLLAVRSSVAALDGFTVGCTGVALLASYAIGRRVAGPGGAWLLTATVACCPVLLPLSTTFMTDGPAFALSAAALALGLRRLSAQQGRQPAGTGRLPALLPALLLALVAVTIRETSLSVPLGLLAGWAVLSWQRRGTRGAAALVPVLLASAGVALATGLFLRWRAGLPLSLPYGPVTLTGQGPPLGRLLVTLALLLLPVLLGRPAAVAPRAVRVVAAAAAVTLDVRLWQHYGSAGVLTGNLAQAPGPIGAVLRGPRPALLPPAAWSGIGLIALGATVLLAVRTVDLLAARGVSAEGVAARRCLQVALLAATGLLVVAQLHGKAYDRYLLLPLLLSGTLLAGNLDRAPQRSARALPALAAAALACLGLALCLDIDGYDAARWQAGARVAAGLAGMGPVRPGDIDAGFEWVSFHATGPAHADWSADTALPSWDRRMHLDPCWVVSNGPLPAGPAQLSEVARLPWRDGLRRGHVFVVYRRPAARCRPGTPVG